VLWIYVEQVLLIVRHDGLFLYSFSYKRRSSIHGFLNIFEIVACTRLGIHRNGVLANI